MTKISEEEAAWRLVRALRLDCVIRDDERLMMRAKVLWPSYSYDRADLNCQEENRVWLRQIEADAARRRRWDNRPARDDYLVVMGWLVAAAASGPRIRTARRCRARAVRSGLVEVTEFTRRVALDWDWGSIARWDYKVERPSDYQIEKTRARWGQIVIAAASAANALGAAPVAYEMEDA